MLSNAMLKEYPVTQSNVNKVTGLDGFSKVKVASIPSQGLECLFTSNISGVLLPVVVAQASDLWDEVQQADGGGREHAAHGPDPKLAVFRELGAAGPGVRDPQHRDQPLPHSARYWSQKQ